MGSVDTFTNNIPSFPKSDFNFALYGIDQSMTMCVHCGEKSEIVEDHKSGDLICSSCGNVSSEKLISTQAENRVFADEPSSKMKGRTGNLYNPFTEHNLTEKSRLERDEKEFLWDGLKNIDEICFKLYNGDLTNSAAQQRAKELFQRAFHMQVQQKKGVVPMKRSNSKKKDNRIKFSKRKQFVVACLHKALEENNIKTWTITDLSTLMDGIQVSNASANNCLKDLERTEPPNRIS